MQKHLTKEIARFSGEFEKKLGRFMQTKARKARSISPSLARTLSFLGDSLAGGKHLRPFLVVLGTRCGKRKIGRREIFRAALAIEIAHGSILIHDDILDKSELRRGKPALHVRARAIAPAHGEGVAIVAADIGWSFSFELLNLLDVQEADKQQAIARLMGTYFEVGLGQLLDLILAGKERVQRKDILALYFYKTSRYTFVGPLVFGAGLGGAPKRILRALETYGDSLGMAFQMQDDTLGIFGDEATIGKPVGSDIEEGKKTLLWWEAYKRATCEERRFIARIFGKENLRSGALKRFQKICVSTGALKAVSAEARRLAERSKQALRRAALPPDARALLEELADYAVTRSF